MQKSNGKLYFGTDDLVILGVSKTKSQAKDQFDNWQKRIPEAIIKHPNDKRMSFIAHEDIPAATRLKMGTLPELMLRYNNRRILDLLRVSKSDLVEFRDWMQVCIDDEGFEAKITGLAKSAALCRLYLEVRNGGRWRSIDSGYRCFKDWLSACYDVVKQERWEGLDGIRTLASFAKKLNTFKARGNECLVNGHYGNQNCRKVNDEALAMLGSLYSASSHNAARLSDELNKALVKTGLQKSDVAVQLSQSTVKRYLSEPEFQFVHDQSRYGKQDWRNNFEPISWRKPPSRAGLLWVLDGTPIECYYQYYREDKYGRKVQTMGRLYAFFVLDAHSWKIVGVSVGAHGEKESKRLVQAAVSDAYFKEGYCPNQVMYDHSSSIVALEPWLAKLCQHLTPAQVGNARAKVIEPFIMQFFERQAKSWANFSGLGIKSKRKCSHISDEWLKANYQNFPDATELTAQIHTMVSDWNSDIRSAGPAVNRIHEGIRLNPNESHQNSINAHSTLYEGLTTHDEVNLLWQFNLDRSGNPETYEYTNGGITITRSGIKKHYTVIASEVTMFDVMRRTMGQSYCVKTSPSKPQSIWLQQGDRLLVECVECEGVPMALADRVAGDGAKIAQALSDKEEFAQHAKQLKTESDLLAAEAGLDAELILRNPFATKNKQYKNDLNHAEDQYKQRESDYFTPTQEEIDNFEL